MRHFLRSTIIGGIRKFFIRSQSNLHYLYSSPTSVHDIP
jgi:hypothetical protein